MYTQKDIDSVNAQMKKRVMVWWIPKILVLSVLVYSFIIRLQWLSGALFSLLAMMIYFSVTMSILPVKRYKQFLNNAVHGKNRVDTLRFDTLDQETVEREGVRFYPVTMRADTLKEELDERQFYWDANLSLPDWTQGSYLKLTSHERMIIGWENA
ncbi:MAG: hypothetical protein QM308_03180 [Bacillota bacterium]|nr:hypothetical protein [Bacillota bacterium]